MTDSEKLKAAAIAGAEKYADSQLTFIKTLASIDCGSGNEAGNAAVVTKICGLLSEMGAEAEVYSHPGVGRNIVARLRPEKPEGKILLSAHTDTVFEPGDAVRHPVRLEDDWAWGLGVADCKGGICVSLYAVRIMREAGLLPNKEIVWIFTCDEEIGSLTGRICFEREAAGAEMAFVFEPARAQNGVLTSRRGWVQYNLEVAGKASHAGLDYHKGSSAVVELAYQTVRLYEKNNRSLSIAYNISPVHGGNKAGSIPESANAKISTSIASGEALEQVEKDMRAIEDHAAVEGCANMTALDFIYPCMERSKGSLAVYCLVRRAGALLGQDLPEQGTGGYSDANLLTDCGVPTVCGLGPYMQDIHTYGERLYIPSIKEKTALFAAVLGLM